MSYSKIIEIPKNIVTITYEQFYNQTEQQLDILLINLRAHGYMKDANAGDILHLQSVGNSGNSGKLIFSGYRLDQLDDSVDDTMHLPPNYTVNDFLRVDYFANSLSCNNIIWLESSICKLKLLKKFGKHIFKYTTIENYIIYTPMVDLEDIYLNHGIVPCSYCNQIDSDTYVNLFNGISMDFSIKCNVIDDIQAELDKKTNVILAHMMVDYELLKWKYYEHDSNCVICNQ